jgi:hypothetical protein
MELKNLRKEAKTLLPDRPHFTLKADNFQAWKSNILSEADLIEAKYILEEEQTSVPEDCDELGESLWKEKRKILYTRISASLHYTVRKVADSLETKCPVTIWQALNDEYGVSKAEERLTLMKQLRDISLESNDYSQYLQKFRMLWRELGTLKITLNDLEHDFFILGLCDYQKQFVKTQLDAFYHEGRDRIKNIDLRQFQYALLARHRTFKGSKKDTYLNYGQAKAAASKPTEKKEKDPLKNNNGKSRFYQTALQIL